MGSGPAELARELASTAGRWRGGGRGVGGFGGGGGLGKLE
jgi:hypothetical protein